MKIYISVPNDCSQDEINKKEDLQKITNVQEVEPLEEGYPFTLDLIYHRRQPGTAALISLLVPGFGGFGQLLLGQESKAGLLLLIEWLGILPLGLFSGALPYFLLSFHLFTALDSLILAGRLKRGQTLKKWEWFWTKSFE
jgi:hypothetical protein